MQCCVSYRKILHHLQSTLFVNDLEEMRDIMFLYI